MAPMPNPGEHLPGSDVPDIMLRTPSSTVGLRTLALESAVLFLYPGDETQAAASEAKTPSSCAVQRAGFREHALEFAALGARIAGISCEPPETQASLMQAEKLPFPLLTDCAFELAAALGLPTFDDRGTRRYRRQTLIYNQAGTIQAAFYPVSPKRSALQALAWLQRSADR